MCCIWSLVGSDVIQFGPVKQLQKIAVKALIKLQHEWSIYVRILQFSFLLKIEDLLLTHTIIPQYCHLKEKKMNFLNLADILWAYNTQKLESQNLLCMRRKCFNVYKMMMMMMIGFVSHPSSEEFRVAYIVLPSLLYPLNNPVM